MDYATFFKRFGGSARRKNVAAPGGEATRPSNKRPYLLPQTSELPLEFIRLCPWEMEYLFTVARRARIGIIETGRFNGGSCFVMACAAENTTIHSIDIAPKDDALLKDCFSRTNVGRNVELFVGDSQNTTYDAIGEADLIFIDADHTYEGCLADIENWYDRLVVGGQLLFHDSYLGSWGVQDAVADFMLRHRELEIVQSPFIGAAYWWYPAGSIAHLVRRF